MFADQSPICFEEGFDPRLIRVHPRLISPSLYLKLAQQKGSGCSATPTALQEEHQHVGRAAIMRCYSYTKCESRIAFRLQ